MLGGALARAAGPIMSIAAVAQFGLIDSDHAFLWEGAVVEALLIILREARDPRDFTARDDLVEMLFLVLCGLLCGEKTRVDLADFAAAHEAAFREVRLWAKLRVLVSSLT